MYFPMTFCADTILFQMELALIKPPYHFEKSIIIIDYY